MKLANGRIRGFRRLLGDLVRPTGGQWHASSSIAQNPVPRGLVGSCQFRGPGMKTAQIALAFGVQAQESADRGLIRRNQSEVRVVDVALGPATETALAGRFVQRLQLSPQPVESFGLKTFISASLRWEANNSISSARVAIKRSMNFPCRASSRRQRSKTSYSPRADSQRSTPMRSTATA